MIRLIREYETMPFLRTYRSLPPGDYLNLMQVASVLVGNSSSGIIEAPSFGLPVVNIGTRQQGREQGCNVLDVSYEREEIRGAIEKALYDTEFRAVVKRGKNPYGDGKAAQRIVEVLSHIPLGRDLLQKKMSY